MSKNPIAELFMKEEQAKAKMYREKASSSTLAEAKQTWLKMAERSDDAALVFELYCM